LRKTPAAATIVSLTGFPPQQVLSNKNIKIKPHKAKRLGKKTFSGMMLTGYIRRLIGLLGRRWPEKK
jgi:hypothetical protein